MASRKNIFRIFLFVVSIAAFGYLIVRFRDGFQAFENLSLVQIATAFTLAFLALLFQTLQFKACMNAFELPIGFEDSFHTNSLSAFYNLIFPLGGVVVRSILTAKFSADSYRKAIMAMGVFYLFSYAIVSFISVGVCFLWFPELLRSLPNPGYWSYGIICILIVSSIFFGTTSISPIVRVREQVVSLLSQLNSRMMVYAIIYQLLYILVTGITFALSFYFLGAEVSFERVFVVHLALSILLLVNIVPGNFGVREAATLMFSSYLGVGYELIIAATVLFRVIFLVLILVAAGLAKVRFLAVNKNEQ